MVTNILLAATLVSQIYGSASPYKPSNPFVTLNNGLQMPTVLWGSGGDTQENATSTAPAVRDALNNGFPGIDCANHYHNQVGVAKGIEMSQVERSDIFLATKIEPCGHSRITPLYEGHCYNESLAAFDQNLVQLNTDFVDLTLLHSPPCIPNSTWADSQCMWPDQPDAVYPQHCNCAAEEPCKMMKQQWMALEKRYKEGKTKAIGVSNFCQPCLECIAEIATVVPAVNQLQFHVGMPGEDPNGLISYSNGKGVTVQAYSPLGGDAHSALLNAPELVSIAKKHNQSTSSVCLKWVMQLGHALATSTTNVEYMKEDMNVYVNYMNILSYFLNNIFLLLYIILYINHFFHTNFIGIFVYVLQFFSGTAQNGSWMSLI
jgi:diketogulonate reductase-like aldo/keto reductase